MLINVWMDLKKRMTKYLLPNIRTEKYVTLCGIVIEKDSYFSQLILKKDKIFTTIFQLIITIQSPYYSFYNKNVTLLV